MPSLEALPQACSIAWENAPRVGAFCWQLIEQKPVGFSVAYDVGNVW